VNNQSLLRAALTQAHSILDEVMADCTPEVLGKQLPAATIGSVGAVYAHAVFGEDGLVQGMVQGKPPIYEAQGWSGKLGVPMPGPMQNLDWAASVKIDLQSFGEYAKAVFAATDAYIAGASDAEMERSVETGFAGAQPVAQVLGTIVLWHMVNHQGEIAALKGVQGKKGLPF